jgi:hypothetical protein
MASPANALRLIALPFPDRLPNTDKTGDKGRRWPL